MLKRQSTRRRAANRSGRSIRHKNPPPLPAPFEPASQLNKLKPIIKELFDAKPGSTTYKTMGGKFGSVVIQGVHDAIADGSIYDLNWPPGLYIPAGANPADYWGTAVPPAENRYALAWTNGIGFATASVNDGSLHAISSSPTVQGAINGKTEAGVGVICSPKHTLVRLGIEPDLTFTGLYQWDVDADPVVLIRTRVIGSVQVGAFQSNPATGAWEQMLNFTWRRHELFDDANQGSGMHTVFSVPFKASGPSAGISFTASSGRSYLIAVVAQVALKVETLNARGRPISVANGKFETFGSVTGIVRQIWVDQKVLVN